MIDENTACRCARSSTGVPTARRSARTPFSRWNTKSGFATMFAYQLRRAGEVER